MAATPVSRTEAVRGVLRVPDTLVPVSPPEGATVLRLTRPEGSAVRTGDTIGLLNISALEQAHAAQTAILAATNAVL